MRPGFRRLVTGCAAILLGAGSFVICRSKFFESNASSGEPASRVRIDLTAIALLPPKGAEPIDLEIRKLQDKAKSKPMDPKAMVRLGWAFVKKARLTYDPGYYKFAEQAVTAAELKHPNDPDALLLRGHVLESLHQFNEAEPIARQLITIRRQSSDYGLLGDSLMEQGRLAPAVEAYQKMVDLRPDLEAYTRIAHMRWLTGDLDGALEIMQTAVTGTTVLAAEGSAWAYTRLGMYQLQKGQLDDAAQSATLALEYAKSYPAALSLQGKILLAQGKVSAAVPRFSQAAEQARLPEYQWILADALREAGQLQAAANEERQLAQNGASNDPRTFAIYLASRGQQLDEALRLALAELKARQDVFTMDAVGWALYAEGRYAEAAGYSQKSLLAGTQDARLFYHAGCIAMKNENRAKAEKFFQSTAGIRQMLFPSERTDFDQKFAALQGTGPCARAVSSN